MYDYGTSVKLADDVAFQSVGQDDEDTVVLSLKSGYLYTCNGVAASFLSAVDGQKTFGQVLDALEEEYNVDRATLEADMTAFIENLSKENLITTGPAA